MQRIIFKRYTLTFCNIGKMLFRVFDSDPFEIKNLATRQYGRNDLVFFGRSQNKNGVFRWFLKRFQKSIECSRRQHVDLVNNINFILSCLWWNTNLINQIPNIVNGIVRSRVKFKYIERKIFRRIIITRLVDLTCKDSGASCFSDTSWTREKQGRSKVIRLDRVEQSIGNRLLPDNILECLRTVFARRYYKLLHRFLLVNKYRILVYFLIGDFAEMEKTFPQVVSSKIDCSA